MDQTDQNIKEPIFICWSGDTSLAIAEEFKDWLQKLVPGIDPWLSADMAKGKDFFAELKEKLKDCRLGLICLTSDNFNKPWVMFEAGALMVPLSEEERTVFPFLFNVKPADRELLGPLKHLQLTERNKKDIKKLIISINSKLPNKEFENVLEKRFESLWHELDDKFNKIELEEAVLIRGWPDTKSEIENIIKNAEVYIYGIVEDFSTLSSFKPFLDHLNESTQISLICSSYGKDLNKLKHTLNSLNSLKYKPEINYVHPIMIGKIRILFNEKFGLFVIQSGDDDNQYFGTRIKPVRDLENHFNLLKKKSSPEIEIAKYESKFSRIKINELANLIISSIKEMERSNIDDKFLYVLANKFTLFVKNKRLGQIIKRISKNGDFEIKVLLSNEAKNCDEGFEHSTYEIIKEELGDKIHILDMDRLMSKRRMIIMNKIAIDLIDFGNNEDYYYSLIQDEEHIKVIKQDFDQSLK